MRTANDINIKGLHKLYKKKGGKLTSAQASKAFLLFFRKVAEECIKDNFELRLPRRMGFIAVKKYKNKTKFKDNAGYRFFNIPVDWKATKEMWKEHPEAKEKKKVVFHKNEETHGHILRFYWDNYTCPIKNKYGYYFKATRYNNRR